MSSETRFDRRRFARTLTLIVFVTAVFLLLIAQRLGAEALQIGVVAVGTVALVTAATGFLIAAASRLDEPSSDGTPPPAVDSQR